MWKAYKYTYYWLYTWQKKLWGEVDLPQYNVILGLSLSLVCNILSLFVLTEIALDIILFPEGISKKMAVLPLMLILATHYFLFVYNSKYKKIEQEFKGEGKEERKHKGRWVLLYTFGSMAFYIFLMFFGIWVKHG